MKKLLIMFLMALLPAYASAGVAPPGATAQGQVNGTVSDVAHQTDSVFKKMKIQPSGVSSEKSGAEQTRSGKKGDLNVEVKLQSAEGLEDQTKVEVTAKREGALNWDNEYAKKVLQNIVAAG